MRDKSIKFALGISLAIHLAAVCVIGLLPASGMRVAAPASQTAKQLDVDLVADPMKPAPAKPKPLQYVPPVRENREEDVSRNEMIPQERFTASNSAQYRPTSSTSHPRVSPRTVPGNPGGKLNVGTLSAHGDLGGNWSGGRTPVGWVPGGDSGTGRGSGNSAGEGTPEPPKHADDGPGLRPAPAPDPPEPRRVSVRVCDDSGMIPGENCKGTHTASYIDGDQPTRTCNKCKAPEPVHKSRLADQEKPIQTKDTRVNIPASVEEGLSVEVRIEYTVTDDGNVTGIQILKSSGDKAIDRAVINAASGMRYKPAVQDGVARSVKMTRTYRVNT